MGSSTHAVGVKVEFADTPPGRTMFFNSFGIERSPTFVTFCVSFVGKSGFVYDDFVWSMTIEDFRRGQEGLKEFAARLGAPAEFSESAVQPLSRERMTVQNARVIHAAHSDEFGEIVLFGYSHWHASFKLKQKPQDETTVNAYPLAVLSCGTEMLKHFLLEFIR